MRIPNPLKSIDALAVKVGGRRARGAKPRTIAVLGRVVASAVVVALVAAAFAVWPRNQTMHVTGMFSRAVGLYPGSDVRVLGVPIGTVISVTPEGDQVAVEFEYDAAVKIPANAMAAVVSPSLVSDRYVQLLPAYTSGPVMTSGSTIARDHTAVPVELDRISQSLDDLMVALGPDGANKNGALSRLLDTGAKNLNGQRARSTTPPTTCRWLCRHWPAVRTTCSRRSRTCSPSRAPWPPTTPRCAGSTATSPAFPTSSPGSEGTLAPR